MPLIESLEASKRLATEIGEKVAEAAETEIAINDSRNKYRYEPAAACLQHALLTLFTCVTGTYLPFFCPAGLLQSVEPCCSSCSTASTRSTPSTSTGEAQIVVVVETVNRVTA